MAKIEVPEAQAAVLQLALLVLDRSGSMSEPEPSHTGLTKHQAVAKHIFDTDPQEGFLARIKESMYSNTFWIGALTFDDRIEPMQDPVSLEDLDINNLNQSCITPRGTTAIGSALAEAKKMADQFLAGEEPYQPRLVTILLMSDGQNNAGPDPISIANDIKSKTGTNKYGSRPEIVIAAAAYGDNADETTLQSIVTQLPESTKPFYAKVKSGAELRDFFIASTRLAGT